MSTFQPYLNPQVAEAVQVFRSHEKSWPTRVNILAGQLDDHLSLEVLAFMVLATDSKELDKPTYIVHLPYSIASYATSSCVHRLLAGVFIHSTHRPDSLWLQSPPGEDEDVLLDALLPLHLNSLNTLMTYGQFMQLWFYADQIAPTSPFPYQASFTLHERRGRLEHPLRPRLEVSKNRTLYSRYIPHLQEHFQLQYASVDKHLECLHEWMNEPRVDKFWEEAGSLEKHRTFLNDLDNDPSVLPVIGQYVSNKIEPACFFSIYWAKEDRISEYFEADNYDRGIHMLVGSNHHRGPHRVAAWLPSLCHYIFLSDPRTKKIVSEPNYMNSGMIEYLQKYGFVKERLFDFPHKRAALMVLERDDFWKTCSDLFTFSS